MKPLDPHVLRKFLDSTSEVLGHIEGSQAAEDPSCRVAPPLPLPEAQEETLRDFLAQGGALRVGDRVRLNRHGRKYYRFPHAGQVALVSRVLPAHLYAGERDAHFIDGEVAMVGDQHGRLLAYPVDLRFFEKVE